ncbi:MAG: double-strand break repair protein AddB [Sphingomonadales bacterium]
MSRPSIFTIPAGVSFVDALARGLLKQYGADPLALSRVRVLLPTRRAARTLREAFLRLSDGKPLILPVMQPLGDVDEGELAITADAIGALEVPPAAPALERTLLLSDLVRGWRRARGDTGDDPAQDFRLAAELGSFIDQIHTEGCDPRDLQHLAPAEFAEHWQVTIEFLRIVMERWPEALRDAGQMDPAQRRDRLLRDLAQRWRDQPPATPVIAAGSTGSIPASAELIRVIAGLPSGSVVLPGFDVGMDQASWDALDPTHPQYGMKQLLAGMAVDRSEVDVWPHADPAPSERLRLLNEAMRPAETTSEWRSLELDTPTALAGLYRIDAPTEQAEAGAIAMVLRHALETPGMTAALVTPERSLARRVAAALRRWNVEIDDSAGIPLLQTSAMTFMRLTADLALGRAAPVPLLAALKHSLASGGQSPSAFRGAVGTLERTVLRGPRPAPGLAGIASAIAAAGLPDGDPLRPWWDALAARAEPFLTLFEGREAPLGALVRAHVAFAESLADTDAEAGAGRLWVEPAGEAAAAFLEEFIHTAGPRTIDPRQYPALLEAAARDGVVRPAYGRHPRLAILGPLEARLHHADVMILGGLNEGSWPPQAAADPWMSRPMRQKFGLPPPERRIGLSAHDFVQGAAAPLVYLTRAEKSGGSPTLPSRWLLRLDALVGQDAWPRAPHLDWHGMLDHVPGDPRPCAPPEPRPPVEVRPRQLSVTRVEAWMRDPYALYAQRVLRLEPLDPLDADPGAADRGSVIHDALHRYLQMHPAPPDDALEALLRHGRDAFGPLMDKPLVRSFWWPRFQQIARWFLERQQDRLGDGATPAGLEQQARLVLSGFTGGDFTLTARADRIDRRADGAYEIIDYKTGGAPNARRLLAGYAAQMPLQAMMLREGAFDGLTGIVAELAWWTLKGEGDANRIKLASALVADECTLEQLIADAEAGLRRLIETFDDPETPYLSQPNPVETGFGDYDHLARVKEWGT